MQASPLLVAGTAADSAPALCCAYFLRPTLTSLAFLPFPDSVARQVSPFSTFFEHGAFGRASGDQHGQASDLASPSSSSFDQAALPSYSATKLKMHLSGSKAGRLKHRLDEHHRRDAAEAAKIASTSAGGSSGSGSSSSSHQLASSLSSSSSLAAAEEAPPSPGEAPLYVGTVISPGADSRPPSR